MLKKLLGLFFLLPVLAGCYQDDADVNAPAQQETPRPMVVHSPQMGRPGKILVKFRPEVSDSLGMAGTRTRSGRLTSGVRSVDRVMTRVGAVRMERLFPDAGRFEARSRKMGMHLWYVVHFDDQVSLERAGEEFSSSPDLEVIEYSVPIVRIGDQRAVQPIVSNVASTIRPAATRTPAYPFNDPQSYLQWHYANDGTLFSAAKAGADINIIEAWKRCTGSPEVIVSIVDEGVQYDHPDLKDNMWVNTAELNGLPNVDDDNNGYVDDIYGYDFVAKSPRIDPGEHGTHVAGTVSAVNNNGVGVCGVAGGNGPGTGAKIMTCGIFDSSGYENADAAGTANAIKYGADNGAVICQNSWGYEAGYYNSVNEWRADNSAEKAAIDYFIQYAGLDENGNQSGPIRGGLVVFAAGNEGHYTGTATAFPAAYPAVLSVAAMAADYTPAWYTCHGSWVDVTAPGGCDFVPRNSETGLIYSTLPSGYGYMAGTSMACPHVSGIAALAASYALQQGVKLTADQLKAMIESSTHNFDQYMTGTKGGRGEYDSEGHPININLSDYKGIMGSGYVDAALVLRKIGGGSDDNQDPVLSLVDAQQAQVSLSYAGRISVRLLVSDPDGDVWTPSLNDPDGCCTIETNSGGLTVTITGSLEKVGTHTASVYVTDFKGAVSNTVTIRYTITDNAGPVTKPIDDMHFEGADRTTIVLAEYFADPDDLLTYTSTVCRPGTDIPSDVVTVTTGSGLLTVTPRKYGTAEVTVTATDQGGLATSLRFQVTVRDGSKPVELYPNPVTDVLNLRMGAQVNGTVIVRVYSSTGRFMLSGEVPVSPSAPGKIDLSGLDAGTYLVEVAWDGKVYKNSIVKR